jgi:hypothetical protein
MLSYTRRSIYVAGKMIKGVFNIFRIISIEEDQSNLASDKV